MPGRRAFLLQLLACVAATNVPIAAQVIPNDPDFGLQWGLRQIRGGQPVVRGPDIRAPEAWTIHSGASGVTVAIVGSGVDPHSEFAGRLLHGRGTIGDPFDTLDTGSVGTHAAGIVGAATGNGIGIAGLIGDAMLLPVRVREGSNGRADHAAAGIAWAVNQHVDVILVLVHFLVGSSSLADAVEFAVAHDVVVVAAVGDSGVNDIQFPAAYDGCIAVSATTRDDTLAVFSSFGSHVDLAAPGASIWSTQSGSDSGYGPLSSTGSAAAFVAGTAALLRSYAPQLSANQIREILVSSADDIGEPGHDDFFGAGRLNAARALSIAPGPALRFEYPVRLPDKVEPGQLNSFPIRIVEVAENVSLGSARLFYRDPVRGFVSAPLLPMEDDLYSVQLPSAPCDTLLEYYFQARGDGGSVVVDPIDAPKALHETAVIRDAALFADDFEIDRGWQVVTEGGPDTRGTWTRDVPIGTSAQPGFDASPNTGQACFFTGQHDVEQSAGWNDVDNGPVRLLSPILALDAPDAEISYVRWFYSSADGTPDELTVDLSRDGGQTWSIVEVVSNSSTNWEQHRFRLGEHPNVVGDQLRVRFSTSDIPNDTLTEAAVDEFRIRAILCQSGEGDFDGDGLVDLADFGNYWPCRTAPASVAAGWCSVFDFDVDNDVDLADFQEFQLRYLASSWGR